MYRLLVADDEANILEGIARFIGRNFPQYEIVAKAHDGRQALEMALEHLPDVIVTDISMPHMNGLDFLESIRGHLPEAKLAVVTGYEDLEYVRQATRIGVRDYLVKPLETEAFRQVLERFAREMDSRGDAWADDGAPLPWPLEVQAYCRAAFSCIPLPSLGGEVGEALSHARQYAAVLSAGSVDSRLLARSLGRHAGEGITVAGMPMVDGQNALLIAGDDAQGEAFFLRLNQMLNAVSVSCRRTLSARLTFFVGKLVQKPEQAHSALWQAQNARRHTFAQTGPAVVNYQDVVVRRQAPVQFPRKGLEEELALSVKGMNAAQAGRLLDELTRWMEETAAIDAEIVRMHALAVCTQVYSQCRDILGDMTCAEISAMRDELMHADSVPALRRQLDSAVALLMEQRRSSAKEEPNVAEQVALIMHQHLSDAEFSLDDVASRLYLSPNYLRQLFKRATGTTFVDHLTRLRMERAMILLRSTEIRIGDVAEEVGYVDARYFSACFKRHTGLTPSEFRAAADNG